MIAKEHWPEMPEIWQPIDTQLTAALGRLPLFEASDFTPQQRVCMSLAGEDNDRAAIADILTISISGVDKHLKSASKAVREVLPLRPWERPKDSSAAIQSPVSLLPQGLVYIALESGVIPIGESRDRVELSPREAIVLKTFALGGSNKVAAKYTKTSLRVFEGNDFPAFKEKMGVQLPQAMIVQSYRMGFFRSKREAASLIIPGRSDSSKGEEK